MYDWIFWRTLGEGLRHTFKNRLSQKAVLRSTKCKRNYIMAQCSDLFCATYMARLKAFIKVQVFFLFFFFNQNLINHNYVSSD